MERGLVRVIALRGCMGPMGFLAQGVARIQARGMFIHELKARNRMGLCRGYC